MDKPRPRRDRDNIRELLLDAAITEFGQKGFEAASTTSIAARADAHQPQINYHFSSKAELWRAAVDRLFAKLDDALAGIEVGGDPVVGLSELIRRMVRFAASNPELNQIMVQEAMAPSDRLVWITDTHVRPRYHALRGLWERLCDLGVTAPIDSRLFHYVFVGASSLLFTNRAEAIMLLGADPCEEELIEAHVQGVIAMLLPGRPVR